MSRVFDYCATGAKPKLLQQGILKGEVSLYNLPPVELVWIDVQIKTKIVSCHTADTKPVKQEVNGTGILPPLVFPGFNLASMRLLLVRLKQGTLTEKESSAQLTLLR